jgi:hypothetical protein
MLWPSWAPWRRRTARAASGPRSMSRRSTLGPSMPSAASRTTRWPRRPPGPLRPSSGRYATRRRRFDFPAFRRIEACRGGGHPRRPRVPVMIPLVYHLWYNITAFGLERLHPFDSRKYRRIHDALVARGQRRPRDFERPRPVSQGDLLRVHTEESLSTLRRPKVLAGIMEIPVVRRLPAWMIHRRSLRPMRYATGGTILACRLVLQHGIAIDLRGLPAAGWTRTDGRRVPGGRPGHAGHSSRCHPARPRGPQCQFRPVRGRPAGPVSSSSGRPRRA